MYNNNKIIGSCPLCEERALHVFGEGEGETQQCISCGYVTSTRYKLQDNQEKSDNKLFQELTEQMKEWSVVKNNRIWIPTMITLPIGMIYPSSDNENVMIWSFAPMVDIPEEEQKNYPIPGQDGKFYTQKYDTDSELLTFNWFAEALQHTNTLMKTGMEETSGDLPDLTK